MSRRVATVISVMNNDTTDTTDALQQNIDNARHAESVANSTTLPDGAIYTDDDPSNDYHH